MDVLVVGTDFRSIMDKGRLREFPLDLGQGKPDLSILAIGEGNKFPLAQAEKYVRTDLAHLLLPCGHPGIKIPVAALADTDGRFFDNLKKAFVVFGGVGVVRLAEKLVGQVAQYSAACLFTIHHVVLYFIL